MKNSINYYTREERNGLTLLITLVMLFTVFVFLQNNNARQSTTVHIHVESGNELLAKQHATLLQNNNTKKDTIHAKEKNGSQRNAKTEVDFSKDVVSNIRSEQKPTSIAGTNKQITASPQEYKQRKSYEKKKFVNYKRKESQHISLSSGSQEEWQKLRGIGKVFSGRIIKYKNWLGGFHSTEQLKEVYGMTDSLYQTIEPFIRPCVKLKFININTCTIKQLGKHPYVNWKDAKKIIAYRKQHGAYKNTSDLDEIIGLDRGKIEKFKPYISFKTDVKLQGDSKEVYAHNN